MSRKNPLIVIILVVMLISVIWLEACNFETPSNEFSNNLPEPSMHENQSEIQTNKSTSSKELESIPQTESAAQDNSQNTQIDNTTQSKEPSTGSIMQDNQNGIQTDNADIKKVLTESVWRFPNPGMYPCIGTASFRDDFTFDMQFVLYESYDIENNKMVDNGSCEYYGTYSITGHQLLLNVESRKVSIKEGYDRSKDNFDYENIQTIKGTISDSNYAVITFESLKYQLINFDDGI